MGPADTAPWAEVVGVAGDIHRESRPPPAPECMCILPGIPPVSPFLGAAGRLAIRRRRRSGARGTESLDKDLSVYDLRTGDELRAGAVSERRFIVTLASLFGILALTLAAMGVYGVMALMVIERAQEMGIRLALGAEPRGVVGLVIGQGLTLAAIGIGLGVGVSLALTPLMSNQLYGVGAIDPITLGSVIALLFSVSLLACAVPARRAMAVDPLRAAHGKLAEFRPDEEAATNRAEVEASAPRSAARRSVRTKISAHGSHRHHWLRTMAAARSRRAAQQRSDEHRDQGRNPRQHPVELAVPGLPAADRSIPSSIAMPVAIAIAMTRYRLVMRMVSAR